MVAKYSGKLRVERDGVTNALLVLNNTTGEGILVNSEGSAYARYSAYLPFAKPYLDYEIARIADYCVSEGAENTSDGLWAITFDEVCEHFNIDLSDDPEIRDDLLNILRTREEIAEIVATEDEFEIKYSRDICPPVPVLKEQYEDASQEDVDVALAKHILWVHDVPGGVCANFAGKRFRNVDFSGYKLNRDFVGALQTDIKTVLYDRPTTATSEYFNGKYVKVNDVPTLIDKTAADTIEFYLISNGYVNMQRKVTDKYRMDVQMGTIAPLPAELEPMSGGIHTLIQSVYDDTVLDNMFIDGHESAIKGNPLNDNWAKKEFQALWNQINHKYAYTVSFDSNELIAKAIAHIDDKLFVSELQYTTSIGRQKTEMNEYEVDRGESFGSVKTRTQTLRHAETSQVKYDLIGKIAGGTTLTRKTVAAILKGIRQDKLYMFRNNPEEFISKVIRLISEQKATMIVEHITYNPIEGGFDSGIFTADKSKQAFDKAFRAEKAIQDYVFTDGSAEQSIERKFAQDLDAAVEVCVYAKLPKGFHIPTPVGNYSPDWAIAFYEGTVKHIFFVAETKGTMESLNLRPIEQAKISCAKKLFNEMSNSQVRYHDVDSYQSLLDIMNSMV